MKKGLFVFLVFKLASCMDNQYKTAFNFKDPLNDICYSKPNEKPSTRKELFLQIRTQRAWAKIASANKALGEMDRTLAEQVARNEALEKGQEPDDALQKQKAALKKHKAPSPWQKQANRRGKRK